MVRQGCLIMFSLFQDAQVFVGQYDKSLDAHRGTVQASINQADAFGKIEDKIERLDASLVKFSLDFSKDECEEVAVPGQMQLLAWCQRSGAHLSTNNCFFTILTFCFCCRAWRLACVRWSKSPSQASVSGVDHQQVRLAAAVQLFQIASDTLRRYKQHLTLAELRTLLLSLADLGLSDFTVLAEAAAKECAEASHGQFSLQDVGVSSLRAGEATQPALSEDDSEEEEEEEEESPFHQKSNKKDNEQAALEEYTNISASCALGVSVATFQLVHAGHTLLRDVQSSPDPRVSFYPDGWQKQLLDVVRARVGVVAWCENS